MNSNPIQNIASFFDPKTLAKFVSNGTALSQESALSKLLQDNYLSITDQYQKTQLNQLYQRIMENQQYLTAAYPNVNWSDLMQRLQNSSRN